MRVATVSAIPIRLHWSILLFMVGYALWSLWSGGFGELASAALLLGSLFAIVVLHELGHALAARALGIETAHITLYPFGGIAAIRRMPERPLHELLIAAAGPAVNGVLAVVLGSVWLALGGGWNLLAILTGINVVMGVFNLVPAFPMDGGRIMRACLAWRLGWVRGTRVAMVVGRVFAVVFIVGGVLTGRWSLALVGGFLLFALTVERRRLDGLIAQARRQERRRRQRALLERMLAPPGS